MEQRFSGRCKSMKCDEVNHLMMNVIDNSLTNRQHKAIKKHTEKCKSCAEDLLVYKSVSDDYVINNIISSDCYPAEYNFNFNYDLDEQCQSLPFAFEKEVMSKIDCIDIKSLKHSKLDNTKNILCGILSIFFCIISLLVIYKEEIISILSNQEYELSIKVFIRQILDFVHEFAVSITDSIIGFINGVETFFNSYQLFLVIALIVFIAIQAFVYFRNKNRKDDITI